MRAAGTPHGTCAGAVVAARGAQRGRRAGTLRRAAARAAAAARPGDEFFAAGDERPIILFDGVCNLCNNGVNLVLDLDSVGRVRMAAMQSEAGRTLLRRAGRAEDDHTSVVLVTKERAYTRSEAVLRIGELMDQPFPLPAVAARSLVPSFVRDTLYDAVAGSRFDLFGRSDECRLSDERAEARFIA